MLLALVVPPVGGVGFLARREITARERVASAAAQVVELSAAFVAVADLRSAVTNEQMYVSALTIVSDPAITVPAGAVEMVLGGNLRERWAAMAAEVDRAYGAADRALLGRSVAGRGPLDAALARSIIDGHREVRAVSARLEAGPVDFETVSRTYSAYGGANRVALDAMAVTLADAASQLAEAQGIAPIVQSIDRQVTLSSTMATEVTSASTLIIGNLLDIGFGPMKDEGQLRGDILRNAARRDVNLTELEKLLDPALLPTWQAIRGDAHVIAFEDALDTIGTAAVGSPDLGAIDVAALARHGLDRLDLHNGLLPMLLRDLARTAAEVKTRADDVRDRTVQLATALVVGTLVLLSSAAAAVTRPLRRLRNRARTVRDGVLDPSTRRGSAIAELHDVQLVFEDIVSNLRAIEAQATAIVDGRLDDDAVTAVRPGPLGRSVQESLGRLAAVTRQLQTSEAMSTAIVETAAEAIWAVDADGRVERANAAAQQITMVDSDTARGRSFLDFVDETERPLLAQLLAAGDLDSVEVRMLRPNHATVPVLLSSSQVVVDGDRLTTVIGRDITERKDFEIQLEHNAATDSLTGLPNRRSAVAQITAALERVQETPRGVGVVFCDLDGFKQANDVHGHAFGDDVLREVARRFRAAVRGTEMLARLGGDEFIVVVEDAPGIETANRLAARLLESLQDTVVIGDRRVRINGSFGVAWTDGDLSTSDLLREADVAMFTAKAGGGGQVQLFDEELQQSLRSRVDIEAGLRKALAEDELHFVYQPIIAAGTHQVVGVEALVRWDRPGRGMVSPASFIPVAEQSDLVIEIGRWGLRAAARQLIAWDSLLQGNDFYVAVNVAGVHLSRYDIVADVRATLAEFPVDPRRFRIEITETQLVDDLDVAAEAMRGLAALGIAVVIDDYGTGFSSIAYLRRLPVRGIKIDRSFINQLENERDLAMVESLVILAGLLEMEVVAEGVETETQLLRSEQIGCNHLQGFLMSRPVPADVITSKLEHAHGEPLRRADIAPV